MARYITKTDIILFAGQDGDRGRLRAGAHRAAHGQQLAGAPPAAQLAEEEAVHCMLLFHFYLQLPSLLPPI